MSLNTQDSTTLFGFVEMAYRLLFTRLSGVLTNGHNRAKEASMNLVDIDVSKCDRAEKEVIEGLCLSYDTLKGICLETMQKCVAMQESDK